MKPPCTSDTTNDKTTDTSTTLTESIFPEKLNQKHRIQHEKI